MDKFIAVTQIDSSIQRAYFDQTNDYSMYEINSRHFSQRKNNSNLTCLDKKKINIGIGKQSVFEQVICN